MARETIAQKRASKLEKLKALQAEIDSLNDKASRRIGELAVRAGLADLDVTDGALLKEFRALAARLGKASPEAQGSKSNVPEPAQADAA